MLSPSMDISARALAIHNCQPQGFQEENLSAWQEDREDRFLWEFLCVLNV